MSKTFKCVEHEEEVLEVYPFTGEEAGRKFSLLMPHVSSNAGITFDSTTAPALALTILEAAGYGEEVVTDGSPDGHIQVAKYYLYEGVKAHASITAEAEAQAKLEAEAQAKLEAEALDLFNAGDMEGEFQSGPYDSFGQIHDYAKPKWLAVARRAREMRAEK